MGGRVYYVAKSTGTYADTLAAFGLARLLQAMLRLATGPHRRGLRQNRIALDDTGWAYQIQLSQPLEEAWVGECPFIGDLAPLIKLPPKKPKKGGAESTAEPGEPDEAAMPFPDEAPVSRLVMLDEVWDRLRIAGRIRELDRKYKVQRKHAEWRELFEQAHEPGQDVALLLGDYRMQAVGIHNQAVMQWHQTRAHFATNLSTILELCSGATVDAEKVARGWAKEVIVPGLKTKLTCSQLFNPSMGKGQNRAKADQLAMGNLDEFWLLVYLKVVGLHGDAVSRKLSDDSRKVYVLLPDHLSLAWHQDIFDDFERAVPTNSTSIKLDILAALAYARCWLANSTVGQAATESDGAEYARGLAVATYRLLSRNSYTMINVATLGLPPWLGPDLARQDVAVLKEVIEEQRRFIEPLREDRNTEHNLLVSYREFLTGRRYDAFFDFCEGYGEHLLRALEERAYVPLLSWRSIDLLLEKGGGMPESQAGDLTEFISTPARHPGFHRIARAIYRSTVAPQRQKAEHRRGKGPKPVFEVRYGLAHRLRQQSDKAETFAQELMQFIQAYNAETVQEYEGRSGDDAAEADHRYSRFTIQAADIDDVLGLIQRFGPALVCDLLVAYGYAARGRRSDDEPGTAELQDETAGDEGEVEEGQA
jgi:hypothetical protein